MSEGIVAQIAPIVNEDPKELRCIDCGETKTIKDFRRNGQRETGRQARCKVCQDIKNSNIAARRIELQKILEATQRDEVVYKTCAKCGKSKLTTEFGRKKAYPDGFDSQCKECVRKTTAANVVIPTDPNTKKICVECKQEKPLFTEFHVSGNTKDGHSIRCKQCIREKRKDPELLEKRRLRDMFYTATGRKREGHLRRKYGMTLEDYDRMFADQGGLCAICSTDLSKVRCVIDHEHDGDKRVRGILCNNCNTAEGLLGGNPVSMILAAQYVSGSRVDRAEAERIVQSIKCNQSGTSDV